MTGLFASPCPAGCGRKVELNKLLCGPCWSEVPRSLQRDVNATWRAMRSTPLGDTTSLQYRAAVNRYRAAREAALAAIA